ncbi:crotonase/enoyl-CoA hydratase family protein [Novosphingobium sp. G106]|uniref:crotonase/enoyl-CoA hydratase family protein n=1 Tax=Novosphingobium sp. G106 TaxID=2849500 RepID=UPI001C2DEC4F|nr:crotonase/enoyl-CoA hydratase family protein [Novosphingobium sp. G106]MBV1687880.1 crotonase/enoyl-CoA hydratase family protein [Novosphingobium sp. G106]
MSYNFIRYEVADHVALLTLARPDKLNAISGAMISELRDALERADTDDDVRVLIVTGEGRAFCAGADMSRGAETFKGPGSDSLFAADGSADYGSEAAREVGGVFSLRLYAMTKPVIAAINGAAVGMGATMILPMDIRIASEEARFGFVFARRGMVPEVGSSWFLPRVVGIAKSLEWCLTGRLVPAAEALREGLVSAVVPLADLLPEARRIAQEIAHNTAPVAVALTRQMLWRGLGMNHPMDAHRVESRGTLSRGRSKDAAEGVAAFLEKRAPAFSDRVSADMPDYYPWWEDPAYS